MARLGDLVEQIRGVSYKPEDVYDNLNENSVILLRANNIKDGQLVFDDVIYVDRNRVHNNQMLKAGDILICTSSGSKELVGKAAYVQKDLPMTFGAFCKVVRPQGLCPEYLGHFFNSPNYRKRVSDLSAGANINNIRNEHIDELKIFVPAVDRQHYVIAVLDKISVLISLRRKQLAKLNELVKARFVEMFGDPIKNNLELPTKPLGEICLLKAGATTPADVIFDYDAEHTIPCYGGNGIRGYVKESTQYGIYPIIGRQGALCGNVQLAQGGFHATEHAVLVTPRQKMNIFWIFYLLKYMDLYRYHTGAAQPGLAVKTLNTVEVPIADLALQDEFAILIEKINRHKLTIQQSLDKLEVLKKSLMQEYFGG